MKFHLLMAVLVLGLMAAVLWGAFILPEHLNDTDKWAAGYLTGHTTCLGMQVLAALKREGERP